MSEQLQMKFQELRDLKKERKDLKAMYKDALIQVDGYEEIAEEIKGLREKKKNIELKVQEEMGRSWERIEELNDEIKTQKTMLDDEAINTLMSGHTVEVKDEFDNEYEPEWSVKFKKK